MVSNLNIPAKLEHHLIRISAFAALALILTTMNYPLARFPGQDLLWNDLVLLGRIAWSKAALVGNPAGSIDFLQGLGSNLLQDVKVVPHFYDPGVWLSLLTDACTSLWFRAFFLNLYCLLCLDQLIISQAAQTKNPSPVIRFSLLSAYVLTPQLLQEVSNHFSAIYLGLPGVILTLRYFVSRPTLKSAFAYVAATTLFINLSDVHIFIFGEIVAGFLFLFDPVVRRGHRRFIAIALSFYLILVFSYLSAFNFLFKPEDLVLSHGTWPLNFYASKFLGKAWIGLFVPMFAGPVSTYIAPYLPFFALAIFSWEDRGKLAKGVLLFVAIAAGLFALGVVGHGIGFLRDRLPSAMRYHLSLIPFLANLWVIFHLPYVERVVERIRARRILTLAVILGLAYLFRKIAWWPLFEPQVPFLAFGKYEMTISQAKAPRLLVDLLTVYPLLFSVLALFGEWFTFTRLRGVINCVLAFAVLATLHYAIRSLQQIGNAGPFVDTRLYQELYFKFPEAIDRIIAKSRYAGASRSFIPIAKSFAGNDRGYNDKLLPIIEFPDRIHARSFFHWRYSYSVLTSSLYKETSGQSSLCIFPPSPRHQKATVDLAILTQSPFVISADQKLTDERLDLLGEHTVANNHLQKYPAVQAGLIGTVYVYGVRPLLDSTSGFPFRRADYTHTTAHFSGFHSSASSIRLPIGFSRDLRAKDELGRKVPLWKGHDGFAYISSDGSFHEVTVSSFSILTILSLLAPVFGMVPVSLLALSVLRKKRSISLVLEPIALPQTAPA